jgi:hypothetical protein
MCCIAVCSESGASGAPVGRSQCAELYVPPEHWFFGDYDLRMEPPLGKPSPLTFDECEAAQEKYP